MFARIRNIIRNINRLLSGIQSMHTSDKIMEYIGKYEGAAVNIDDLIRWMEDECGYNFVGMEIDGDHLVFQNNKSQIHFYLREVSSD